MDSKGALLTKKLNILGKEGSCAHGERALMGKERSCLVALSSWEKKARGSQAHGKKACDLLYSER